MVHRAVKASLRQFAAALLLVPALASCSIPSDSLPQARPPEAQPAAGSALDALERLQVKGRAPRTGYDRDAFGPAWADVDRNGCDTRNDISGSDGRRNAPDVRGVVSVGVEA